jgi:chlorobactene glucosyltransferase
MAFVLYNLLLVLLFRLWSLSLLHRTMQAYVMSDAEADRPPARAPTLSVLIPARNEEHNIGPCLSAVLQQDYPLLEIIVIDDASTDQTGAIVEDMQRQHRVIQLMKNNGPPPGWAGKPYALHRGVQHARGEYLLFLDADVRISPDCVRRAMRYVVKYDADLTSMLPVFECVRFWEKVVLPIYGEAFLHALIPFAPPWRRLTEHRPVKPAAYGGFILFKRTAYEHIGGHAHEQVKRSFNEDMELAGVIEQQGRRATLLFGWPAFLRVRMYLHGRHLWEGVSKSISHLKPRLLPFGIYVSFMVFVLPWLAAPMALIAGWRHGWDPVTWCVLVLGLLLSGLALLSRRLLARMVYLDGSYPYCQPLGGLALMAMFANALWRVMSGHSTSWKGRQMSMRVDKNVSDDRQMYTPRGEE